MSTKNSLLTKKINRSNFLIIGILILSFSISFLLRYLPASYGFELHEFDPFFNFRATEYIVNNGVYAYLGWNDELSWYPFGRDVSSNSQVMLHIISAYSYLIFGFGIELYEFVILFPVIIGSLTSFLIFLLTKKIFNTSSGLIASLLFSISFPILMRGQLGWFKSEPLGLFLGIASTYLFLSGLSSKNKKISIIKLFSSGILLTMGISSWGGIQFFILPIGIFIFYLTFMKDNKDLWKIPIFTISCILFSILFERLSSGFSFGLGGLALILPTIFYFISSIFYRFNPDKSKIKINILILTVILVIFSSLIIFNDSTNLISIPSHRYLNAIFPLLTTTDTVTDSVSEHATLETSQSFQFHSAYMIFAAFGIWLILDRKKNLNIKNEMVFFVLALGLIGIYISSAFMRLEVFSSLSIILFSSIGISFLVKSILNFKNSERFIRKFIQLPFLTGLIIILLIPLFLPVNANVVDISSNVPPVILNGGTSWQVSTNDWKDALQWLKDETPEKSVVGAWWDYGYWIQTLAERITLADNSTAYNSRIVEIAKIFFLTPDEAGRTLNDMEVDYFVIFIASEKTPFSTNSGETLSVLGGGGDESKKFWFAKIAGVNSELYLHLDNFSGTKLFWDNTFLGKITPFELFGYVDPSAENISPDYIPGWTGVYTKKIKFSNNDEPFTLVYASDSYHDENSKKEIGIFIYKINKNYFS